MPGPWPGSMRAEEFEREVVREATQMYRTMLHADALNERLRVVRAGRTPAQLRTALDVDIQRPDGPGGEVWITDMAAAVAALDAIKSFADTNGHTDALLKFVNFENF